MYGYGNSMFLATHGILARGGTPPANTVAPVISGSTSLGSVLTSTTGTWTGDAPITYSYQWKRNGIDIGGATSSTYTIVVADSAANLTCQVTATNAAGFASAISNTITAQTFTAPVNTVAPAITGTAQEGQTLTCSTGTWTGNPTPTYAYQWKRNNIDIGSATNSTYLLVTADVGQSIKCMVTATNAVGSANADSNIVTPTAAVDPDAQAFITAASITNPTQQSAINQLVVDLKGYNIWTKMKALYPFVGGTSSTHKWNLKDPRDLDAAFRLVFNGGWTHSSTGATPNGTNGYADTKFKVETNTSQFNNSYGIYSRTNNVSGTFLWGMWDGGANFHMHYVNNYQFYSKDKSITYSAQPTTKLMLATRRSQTDFQAYRNGVSLGTNTTSAWTFGGDYNMYLSARNASGTAQTFMPHELAFAFFADSLTNSEAINLTTAVNNFETALSRNV